ncbi:hypothetical protein ScPMuIL_007869 [Solemya velum]
MDPVHKDILISKRPELVENINMRDGLFTQLIARKILNQRMVRRIQNGRAADQQVEELLDIIPTRGPESFQLFCQALIADDQENVVNSYLCSSSLKSKKNNLNDQACPSSPERVLVHEDGTKNLYISGLSENSPDGQYLGVTEGQYKPFSENESRYVLKHYISDPQYGGIHLMPPREFAKWSSKCTPHSPDPAFQDKYCYPFEKPEKLARVDSIDTMQNLQVFHTADLPGSPTKKQRLSDKFSIAVFDPPVKGSYQHKTGINEKNVPMVPMLDSFDDPDIDLTDGPVGVQVQMANRQFYLGNYKKSYAMRRIPRGKALLINVNEVSGKSARRGTDIDRDNLYNLLSQLHFDVIVHNDVDGLTAKEMALKLQDFAALEDHKEFDCCVICLLSHGEEGFIFGTDGCKIALDDVFTLFDNNNCKALLGKPKIFIVQACRGGTLDRGVSLADEDETDGGSSKFKQMPTQSDMVLCYPTQAGYYAWRNRDRGSWYIEAVVQVFMKHAKSEDICTMLNRVNNVVSRKVSSCAHLDMDQMSQMSEYKSTLRMPHLFFFPGIGAG